MFTAHVGFIENFSTSHFASDHGVKREKNLSKVVIAVVTIRVDTMV